MIICDHLGKEYDRGYVLEDFSFSFAPGYIYALLGPDGCGKTTLMKMIDGLVKPTTGGVYMDDRILAYSDKSSVAYMPTDHYLYDYMSGMQAAKYYRDFYPDFQPDKFMWYMNIMGMDPQMKIRKYSTGMMTKLKVALTMSRNAQMLMLDEPLNGLDPITREHMTNWIRQGFDRRGALLISSPLIEDLEGTADYVIFLRDGRLQASGYSAEFRQKYGKSMTELYREMMWYTGVQS